MTRARLPCCGIAASLIAAIGLWAWAGLARADEAKLENVRGRIAQIEDSAIVIKLKSGATRRIQAAADLTVIALSKGAFTTVTFGSYVGSAAVKLDAFSPIVRDSLSWLHQGFELRIIDDELRGIAIGHKKWDLTGDSIIAHGWVDDMEGRVISIKYGPTEEEETDVEVGRDVPVLKMSVGTPAMLTPGSHVLVGVEKGANGKLTAGFIIVGKDGIPVPF